MIRAAIFTQAMEIAEVLAESRAAFLPYAPLRHSLPEVTAWIEEQLFPSSSVTVAVEEEKIVAFLAASENAESSCIEQLDVRPGFEARGLGTQLLRSAHLRLKRPIRLFTFQQNEGARRFYERNGYHPVLFTDGQDNEEGCPDVLYQLSE